MNTRSKLAGEIGLYLLIMLLVVVAFLALRPGNSNQPGSASLASNDRYGSAGYYPPPQDQTPFPAYSATPRPTHTVPPNWPVYDPNAPTDTPLPVVTPPIEPFPTQIFKFLPENSKEDGLVGLWYPYREGLNANVIFQKILLDSFGQRKDEIAQEFTLEGVSRFSKSPFVLYIQPSVDRSWVFMTIYNREGGVNEILNLHDGTSLSEVNNNKWSDNLVRFWDWSPDGKSILGVIKEDHGWGVTSVINITNGDHQEFITPEYEGAKPTIFDMAYSPDGSYFASVINYSFPPSEKNQSFLEIDLWRNIVPPTQQVLCRYFAETNAQENSLRWSRDGAKILWVAQIDDLEKHDYVKWLWVTNIENGQCEPLLRLSYGGKAGVLTSPGIYSAIWSSDNQKILTHIKDTAKDGSPLYRIVLFDSQTLELYDIVEPSPYILSDARFSPDEKLVVYTVNYETYGEIWAVDLVGGKPFPIAGPTTLYAPFVWDSIE